MLGIDFGQKATDKKVLERVLIKASNIPFRGYRKSKMGKGKGIPLIE